MSEPCVLTAFSVEKLGEKISARLGALHHLSVQRPHVSLSAISSLVPPCLRLTTEGCVAGTAPHRSRPQGALLASRGR